MGHYQTKTLRIKKFGWKRIAKDMQKFGWILDDVEENVTINRKRSYEGKVYGDKLYVDEKVHESKKVVMILQFHRDTSEFENYNKVSIIELIYNIVFLIRRILSLILPIVTIVVLLFAFLGESDEIFGGSMGQLGSFFTTVLVGWFTGIIAESVLAAVAGHILKYR